MSKAYRIIGMILLVISMMIFGSLLFVPYINAKSQANEIAVYQHTSQSFKRLEREAILNECRDYNSKLIETGSLHEPVETMLDKYHSLLNVNGDGIMAVITIPFIDVTLPVYHGTDNMVLRKGAGHCTWSSLPTGERNTHSVITAHNGMAEARMFTDLPLLKPGDTFTLTVLNENMIYTIISIQEIMPDDTSPFIMHPDAALCTLITCIPYGVNNRRLCVTGIRRKQSVNTEIKDQ